MHGPVSASLPTKTRNGLAELSAVAQAVLYVRAHLVWLGDAFVLEEDGARVTPPFRSVRVYTDSEFAEKAATAEYCVHSPGCKELWLQLLEDLDVLEQQWGLTVSSSWVKGRVGVFGNHKADEAAAVEGAAGKRLRDTARSECGFGEHVAARAACNGAAAIRQRARVAATSTPGSAWCNRDRATVRSSGDVFRSAIGTFGEKVEFLAERSELTVVQYNPETAASEERRRRSWHAKERMSLSSQARRLRVTRSWTRPTSAAFCSSRPAAAQSRLRASPWLSRRKSLR